MVASTNLNTAATATTAWVRQQLQLPVKKTSFGNAFTFTNGKIKANRKCKVRINANAMVAHPADRSIGVSVMVNNAVILEGYATQDNNDWDTVSLSSCIMEINKNDTISLNYTSDADNVEFRFAATNYTYLTVEEI